HRDRNAPSDRASQRSAFLTSATNAAILAASLMPLADSTPLDTSTPQGFTRRMASATFPGASPPERTSGLSRCAGTSDQSNPVPAPPYASTHASASHPHASEKGRQYSSKSTPSFTRQALM